MMGGKNHLIIGIIDTFLAQVPEELRSLNAAIDTQNYAIIKNVAHTMKSSVSIMGISILTPVLQEIEELGIKATGIEAIKGLNIQLASICKQALEEVETEKQNYI